MPKMTMSTAKVALILDGAHVGRINDSEVARRLVALWNHADNAGLTTEALEELARGKGEPDDDRR